ncbi:MAG TPA: response regulator transcription factor [Methylomusa anaerophila]|uniref:Response regulator MprA n=1 Tax=Methylomusa anaerophila TaxID=1930071 RepID=A0A348AH51_9FIRM|nr:response regulator transcription factor [Methylomusa anaerophila]BBB90399.1 response regulator MprA [Methylomusa anaerophila]HML90387.1 response regulator transcription factor [Methylomusa anaerophila]
MKLLLVEDESKLTDALSHLLKKNGYAVDTAMDGETGIEMAATGAYDALILDRMLPALDGLSLLREIRSLGFDTPVLFLTAKDGAKDRVEGLDAGADDYLVKPFFADELLARLRALIRRKSRNLVGDSLEAAGLILYPLRCEVMKNGKVIHLTVKETHLLELLMNNYGQVITKERIMEKVWGYNSETEITNVDLYIHYLRKKLNVPYIKTVRGVGYYLQEDTRVPATAL